MADTASRPPPSRARGSGRGGRGGSRGTFRSTRDRTNGDHQKDSAAFDESTEQGEIGEMKKKYSSQLLTLKELFPDWTDVDLLFALQETGGDLQNAVERISEGHVSQFADVKHHKERVKPKSKDSSLPASDAAYSVGSARGRGRSDRGRGGFRGGRGGHVSSNGVRSTSAAVSTPTAEAQGWGSNSADDEAKGAEPESASQWAKAGTSKATPTATSEGVKKSAPPEGPPKKTWAQMFAKPISAPAPPKAAVPSAPLAEAVPPAIETPVPDESAEDQEETPVPPASDDVSVAESFEMVEPPEIGGDESAIDITPPREQLTQENVEHLPDASHPPPTGTQASTLDSASRGPDSATPSVIAQPSQPAPIGRPAMGGYATTAYKATSTSGTRSASFQRRLLDQQESVVMPGSHNTVERAALQFGSMGLNGDGDSPDVDEEREEAETRAQPPQHSPPSQPRAALPPVPRQPAAAAEPQQEPTPTTKPAPGLPPAPQQQQQLSQQSPPGQIASQIASQQAAPGNQSYGQFGRYNQDSSTSGQKNYDPFGQQQSQQSSFDNYGNQSQASAQSQQHSSQLGGYSSAANDYSSYYTAADQRNTYQNYYAGAYGPQSTSQQDAGASQQRTGSAFGAPAGTAGDSSYPSTQGQQSQSRFSENQASGNNTPNPPVGGQQQTGTPSQHMQQPHAQNQQHSGYPYGAGGYGTHYNRMDPYYAAYMNQQYGYGQGGYGNSFGSKGNMYGQPHHGYGMSPGSGYDQHALTPGTGGSFGQSSLQNRDSGFGSSGLGSGIGGSEYTRSGSAQPSQNQQSSSGAGFGGVHDVFGRSGSGYPSQGQQYGQQSANSQGDDSLKPFGENKTAGGPSPSSLNQPGRPGSATNTTGQSSSLPQSQSTSQQHGFGGYPSNYSQMQGSQSSQYGNLGGLGGHQGGQGHQSGYGGGYGAGFGGNYGSYGGRGGWGGNYGQH